MNQIVRQKQMCELIAQRGECSIEELMERFAISGMTVRRDLQSLAGQGKVIRTHGGAALLLLTARELKSSRFLASLLVPTQQ